MNKEKLENKLRENVKMITRQQLMKNQGLSSAGNSSKKIKKNKPKSKNVTPRSSCLQGLSKKTPRTKEEILLNIHNQYGKIVASAPIVETSQRKEPVLKKNLSKDYSSRNDTLNNSELSQSMECSMFQSKSKIPQLKKKNNCELPKETLNKESYEAWNDIKAYMESNKGYKDIMKKLSKIKGEPSPADKKKAVVKVLMKYLSYYSD